MFFVWVKLDLRFRGYDQFKRGSLISLDNFDILLCVKMLTLLFLTNSLKILLVKTIVTFDQFYLI